MAVEKDQQDPRKRSLAAGGKDQYREKLISCWTQRTPLGALRGQRWWEREFKTYEVRAVVFQFLESTRSGTPRDPWMKGEPTPAWDYGTRGSSPFWLGEGRVPRGNVATPEAFVFGVGEPGFLQAGRGSAVWETCTEYHCTPTMVFLKFSQSLRRPPTVATWLKITEPNLEWKGAAASASWWGPPGRVSVWL